MSTPRPGPGLLLDTRGVMDHLGVKRHVAEAIMRALPKTAGLGGTNRIYVHREDVDAHVAEHTVRP